MDLNQIAAETAKVKQKGLCIVLATGVFDLLHREHQKYLSASKKAGDYLLVGVERDSRVREIKGSHRPIQDQATRVKNIINLSIADSVFLLPEEFSSQKDWEKFIQLLKPDIYAVSSQSSFLENKSNIMEKNGGVVKIVHQFNPDVSTTQIIMQQSSQL